MSYEEGGIAALTGFLYQAVGICGLSVNAFSAPKSNEVACTLGLARLDSVHPETAIQDAIFKGIGWDGRHAQKVVQYKYSATGRPIYPKELFEIATALAKGADLIDCDSDSDIGYVLATNRELSDASVELVKAALIGTSHELLGVTKRAKRRQRGILKSIQVINAAQSSWIEDVRAYADSLGVTREEFKKNISALIGEIFASSASPIRSFSRSDFDRMLAGFSSPATITRVALRDVMVGQVRSFGQSARIPAHILPRPRLENLDRALGKFLVLLLGPGGSGKTTTLFHILSAILQQGIPAYYVHVQFAALLRFDHLTQIVASWRNQEPPPAESFLSSLSRLEQAHASSQRPFLILAIDGLDEATNRDREDIARKLLDHAWQAYRSDIERGEPRILLLCTCRRIEDFKNIFAYLDPAIDLYTETIEHDDFSDDELLDLASRLPNEVSQLMLQYLAQANPRNIEPLPIGLLAEAIPQLNYNKGIFEALRQPSIWRQFESLTTSRLQVAALQGRSDAINLIARGYFLWFKEQVGRRKSPLRNHVAPMLHQIAKSHLGSSEANARSWVEAAGAFFAHELYNEALSAGLIQVSRQRWNWRPKFIGAYLASSEFAEENNVG